MEFFFIYLGNKFDLFRIKMNKNYIFYCVLIRHGQKCGATWWSMRTPHGTQCVHVHACVRMCAYVCVCM